MGLAAQGRRSILCGFKLTPPLKFLSTSNSQDLNGVTGEDKSSEQSPEEAFRVKRSHQASRGNPFGFRLTKSERRGERAGP